jgi:hypothetical protein
MNIVVHRISLGADMEALVPINASVCKVHSGYQVWPLIGELITSEVLPSYSAFKRTTIFQLGVAELHRLTAASAFTVSLWSSRVSRLVSPTGRGGV